MDNVLQRLIDSENDIVCLPELGPADYWNLFEMEETPSARFDAGLIISLYDNARITEQDVEKADAWMELNPKWTYTYSYDWKYFFLKAIK